MDEGIYILANDIVFDQLVALVNSIRANAGKPYPICVIPYDDRLEKTKKYIEDNEGIEILDDYALIKRWEDFSTQIWERHPQAISDWQAKGVSGVNRMGMHRRFCAFEGPFERYIYLDADTLVISSLEVIFAQLDTFDWVVYDFQYKDLSHVFDINSTTLNQVFTPKQLDNIFCAGMYASKRNLFSQSQLDWLLQQLEQEADVLYPNGPDQSIMNYMLLKLGIEICNLAKYLSPDKVTGCCVTSPHFEAVAGEVKDKGLSLVYLHYIGIASKAFEMLCRGENIDFPYRGTFLHYRYLDAPQACPKFQGKPVFWKSKPPSFFQKVLKKISLNH